MLLELFLRDYSHFVVEIVQLHCYNEDGIAVFDETLTWAC